ncbi:MAG: DUF362 domain-containing protein [Myxococcota bacterium]
MKDGASLTRRHFLGSSAAVLGGGAGVGCSKQKKPEPGEGKPAAGEERAARSIVTGQAGRSKVILIRDEKVMDENRRVDAAVLAAMLDGAVTNLLGEPDAAKAWARLIKPSDAVGIKTNEWRFLRTPPELETALRERVMRAGVGADRLSVGDRQVLSDPIFQRSTALINVRPMRTHYWSGVGTCIKNYIMFHPSPPAWHDNACANLAGIWKLPIVEGKTRLNVLVMLSPLFHGKGPHHFHAEYTWNYKGLIVGLDPVAVDATGVRVLEAKRREHFGKDEPFGTPVTHLEVAEEKYELGYADPSKIDVVKMGWREGVLV